jgi:hypothetical protein
MPRLPAGLTIEPGTGRVVPVNPRAISQRRFMARLSIAEQMALNMLRADVAGDPELAAALETLADLRDMSQPVMLDDDDTQFGVAFSINCLVSLPEGAMGRIPSADAPARVDAWLADFPQPGEADL